MVATEQVLPRICPMFLFQHRWYLVAALPQILHDVGGDAQLETDGIRRQAVWKAESARCVRGVSRQQEYETFVLFVR